MHIRSFQLSDHFPLTQLLQEVLTEQCYLDTMSALTNQLSWDYDLVQIALLDQQIVGVIIGTIENNQGYYYRIVVETNSRQKGIGKLLLESMKQKFIRRKVHKIFVTLDVYNEALIPFYQALGYETSDFTRTPHRLSIVRHA